LVCENPIFHDQKINLKYFWLKKIYFFQKKNKKQKIYLFVVKYRVFAKNKKTVRQHDLTCKKNITVGKRHFYLIYKLFFFEKTITDFHCWKREMAQRYQNEHDSIVLVEFL
jgi:hypothetical protein